MVKNMKKALICPNESQVQHITGWTSTTPYKPIYSAYPNSCRVAEVCDTAFEIAPPWFWTYCDDNVVADQFYFDTVTEEILPIINVPKPEFSGLQNA